MGCNRSLPPAGGEKKTLKNKEGLFRHPPAGGCLNGYYGIVCMMTDNTETTEPLPEEVAPVLFYAPRSISIVWLLPVLAVLIGAWLAYKTISEKGPEITIRFQTADGLVAGKTRIKYKAVEIGAVESVQLNRDLSGVVVTARIMRAAEPYLREGSKFWVVRPRLSLRGISGLDTLMAGVYIEMEPGHADGFRTEFTGLETPQVVRMDAPGDQYILMTETLGSLDIGSPLYYRDIPVGEVLGYTLAEDDKNIEVHLFVRAPYHQLVQENTRFWKVSGIDFSISTEGVDVKTESLQSLWMGGIAFDTPETLKKSSGVQADHFFWLYENKAAIAEQAYTKKILFVLYFDESVRGLSVNAPVEFRGIKVGKVTEIRMQYDPKNTTFRIPVLVQIEPERIHDVSPGTLSDTENASYALLEALVQSGLRAQLQTGSYLTGKRFVALDMYPDSPLHLSGLEGKFPELPTMSGSMGEITTSISRLLKVLQAMPLTEMAEDLHNTLKGANQMINAPEWLETIHSLKMAATRLDKLLMSVDERVGVLGNRFEGVSDAAQKTLVQTEKTMAGVEGVINPQAPMHYNLMEVTKELSATARTLRSFIEMLESRPESLLFGKEK